MSTGQSRIDFLRSTFLPLLEARIAEGAYDDWQGELNVLIRGKAPSDADKAEALIDVIFGLDPDQARFKNVQRMLSWLVESEPFLSPPEMFNIADDVRFFHEKRGHSLFGGPKDLGRYTTPHMLALFLAPFRNAFLGNAYFQRCDARFLGAQGGDGAVDIVYEDPQFRLMNVKSEEAAIAYFKNMRNCVAYTEQPNHFDKYSGSLLLLMSASGRRWALSFRNGQVRDENDRGQNIDLYPFVSGNPGLMAALDAECSRQMLAEWPSTLGNAIHVLDAVERMRTDRLCSQLLKNAISPMLLACTGNRDSILGYNLMQRIHIVANLARSVPPETILELLKHAPRMHVIQQKGLDILGLETDPGGRVYNDIVDLCARTPEWQSVLKMLPPDTPRPRFKL